MQKKYIFISFLVVTFFSVVSCVAILYFNYCKNVDLERVEIQTKIESLKDFFSYYYWKRDFIKLNQLLLTAKTANTEKLEIVSLNSKEPISFINLSVDASNRKNSNDLLCDSRVIQYYGEDLCKVNYCIDKGKIFSSTIKVNAIILVIVFFILILSLALILLPFYLFNHFILNTISTIHEIRSNNPKSEAFLNFSKEIDIPILKKLVVEIYHLFAEKELLHQQVVESEKKGIMAKIASQVSHDIRSPLAALNMAIKRVANTLPEEERVIIRGQIRRIQDIANDLLFKKRELEQGVVVNSNQLSVQLLSSCIDEIITEKRLQYRQFLDLNIEGDIDNSYGIFSKINLTEFKRMISNVINNSIDAFPDKKGKVVVHLVDVDDRVEVVVADNGTGIPAHIIDKLGQEGVSHGKENNKDSGSGLGLYHAKSTVEKWNGNFSIESTEGVGTKVILSLPKITPPSWFLPNIEIRNGYELVILDDDTGIHATWDDRLTKLEIEIRNIKVHHISSPDGLAKWIDNNVDYAQKNIVYLFDFELIGFKQTGLDLIEKYKLSSAILVTSHYEEDKIQSRCKELGVKLIPKMLAGLVPIKITELPELNQESIGKLSSVVESKITFDALYLDDDPYLRKGWERAAAPKGVKLITIASPDEFYNYENQLSKESTEIYLDSDLGAGVIRGEEFAVILHNLGYKKLSMSTGYDASKFSHLPWLECRSKESPWETEDDW
ncbi:MAG: HAMP domain-containing histidine kinase [Oligoflexia bacterium]|nr:HAMP domain-containing histidine kinase [Oligoflexia bacterium]